MCTVCELSAGAEYLQTNCNRYQDLAITLHQHAHYDDTTPIQYNLQVSAVADEPARRNRAADRGR